MKVMFLHLSVIPSVHMGVGLWVGGGVIDISLAQSQTPPNTPPGHKINTSWGSVGILQNNYENKSVEQKYSKRTSHFILD